MWSAKVVRGVVERTWVRVSRRPHPCQTDRPRWPWGHGQGASAGVVRFGPVFFTFWCAHALSNEVGTSGSDGEPAYTSGRHDRLLRLHLALRPCGCSADAPAPGTRAAHSHANPSPESCGQGCTPRLPHGRDGSIP